MKINLNTIMAVVALILLAIIAFSPSEVEGRKSTGQQGQDLVQTKIDQELFLAAQAQLKTWLPVDFQSAEIELFAYEEGLNKELDKFYDGTEPLEVTVEGGLTYLTVVPLSSTVWVNTKVQAQEPGFPEPLHPIAIEAKGGKYIYGLARHSDVVANLILSRAAWAPTGQAVGSTDFGTEVISQHHTVVSKDQCTEPLLITLSREMFDPSYTYWINLKTVAKGDSWKYTLSDRTYYLVDGDFSKLAGRLGVTLDSGGLDLTMQLLDGGVNLDGEKQQNVRVVVTLFRKKSAQAST